MGNARYAGIIDRMRCPRPPIREDTGVLDTLADWNGADGELNDIHGGDDAMANLELHVTAEFFSLLRICDTFKIVGCRRMDNQKDPGSSIRDRRTTITTHY